MEMHPDGMLDALRANGPHPAVAARMHLFGQFVGSWDVDVVNVGPDGQACSFKAEWHFGWVLEGRAVMDVWMALPLSGHGPAERYEYGASLRFFDDEIDAWRSTWIGPVRHLVRPFIARPMGSEIVLEGSFAPGTLMRWLFSDIEVAAFRWRNIESNDGGHTWTEVQRMAATRRR
jgi:hypothetical protein